MAWGSAKTIIMAFLFIGILLLIIGYFYFGYFEEGFQTSGNASGLPSGRINTCATGTSSQKCSATCITKPLIKASDDEEQSYNIYESKHLRGVGFDLTMPAVQMPTNMKNYNSGGALTANDLDTTKPIPWDFDNKDIDPGVSLWGNICAEASQLIYKKCVFQSLYGAINGLDYDPAAGLFSYKSQVFGITIYDQQEAAMLQISEMFIQNWMGETMGKAQEIISEWNTPAKNRATEALFKIQRQIADYKDALKANNGSELDAVRVLMAKKAAGDYDLAWHNYKNPQQQIPQSDFDKLPLDDERRKQMFGRKSTKVNPIDIDFTDENAAVAKMKTLLQNNADSLIKEYNDLLDGKPTTPKENYKSFRSKIAILAQEMKRKSSGIGSESVTLRGLHVLGSRLRASMEGILASRRATQILGTKVTRAAVELGFSSLQAILTAMMFFPPTAPIAAPINAAITAIRLMMIAIEISCMTYIAPLFNTFIDYDAVCPLNPHSDDWVNRVRLAIMPYSPAIGATLSGGSPLAAALAIAIVTVCGPWLLAEPKLSFLKDTPGIRAAVDSSDPGARKYMWNIQDELIGNPYTNPKFARGDVIGGNIGWNILQNIPIIGPFLMAFGPYICIPNDGSAIRLKNNLRSPPYYFDPTLSIYNAGKKPAFEAGTSEIDRRLYNPLTFHYNKDIRIPKDSNLNPGYPVWVDFANKHMLNKMAQFYYDFSRKCAITTADGMLTFEYISKFMGLISTTELTCDVQCEITQVTFDPSTGIKICEEVVKIPSGTLNIMHHDRRFYFYKDMSRSVLNRTMYIEDTNTIGLQNLMEDNMNIYIVTACTNTDGTAPDCTTYDSEGSSVENPVISLGQPGGEYQVPTVLFDNRDNSNLPTESTCGRPRKYSRFNGITHPAVRKFENTREHALGILPITGDAQIAGLLDTNGDAITDDWIYKYVTPSAQGRAISASEYLYPDAKTIQYLRAAGNNVPETADILQTTKYWDATWNQTCMYDDWNCSINSKQGRGQIIQGTIEGFIGSGLGIGQVQQTLSVTNRNAIAAGNYRFSKTFNRTAAVAPLVGGLAQTVMAIQFPGQEMSLSQQISCIYEEMVKSPGTWIINGRVKTVQQGFIIDQGPFINWAPGYRPTINYCTHQSIELYDCVNQYAVRRFVNIYHAQRPDRAIKKIYKIHPALNKESWNVNNSKAMCVYNIETVAFDSDTFTERSVDDKQRLDVGLYLQQNVSNKTCTFVPNCMPNAANPNINLPYTAGTSQEFCMENTLIEGAASISTLQYKPIIYTLNANERVWPGEEPTATTPLLPISSTDLRKALDFAKAGESGAKSILLARQQPATPTSPLELLPAIIPPTFLPIKDNVEATPPSKYNCNEIKQKLIDSFNKPLAHDGKPKLLSVTDTKTVSIANRTQYMCVFKARFGTVWNKTTSSYINTENTDTDAAAYKRNLTILLDNDGNFLSDDFPIDITAKPIPQEATWFDVPPRVSEQLASTSFKRPNCETDTVYNDCSNSALIDILVTQYNQGTPNSKILKVWRSFTPARGGTSQNPICDYDVERLKTVNGGATILNRETVRFTLKFSDDPTNICAYDLDLTSTTTNTSIINQGVSLNLSPELGLLVSPYTAAVTYSKNIQNNFINSIKNYMGYDIPNITNTLTTNTLTTMQTLRKSLAGSASLKYCPSKSCMDNTVISAMINRYNFDNYPPYPAKQNTVTKNTIIRVTKVGTATPVTCQAELYLRTDFFVDFLYKPLPEDTQYFIHNYAFNLLADQATPCKFKVKPFTRYDISYNTMDISGDAFTLACPSNICPPGIITRGKWLSDYKESMIPSSTSKIAQTPTTITYNDAILEVITRMYNTTPIFTKAGTNYNNKITNVTRVFNAMPNIIELKVKTIRVYWDIPYNIPYYIGDTADDIQESYIIACWPEGTDYEVETGYFWKDDTGAFVPSPNSEYWKSSTPVLVVNGKGKSTVTLTVNNVDTTKVITMCSPGFWKDSTGGYVPPPSSTHWETYTAITSLAGVTTSTVTRKINGVNTPQTITLSSPAIQEIFYPDLTFTANEVFKKTSSGSLVKVYLPYLANDTLTPVDSRQARRYECNPGDCRN
jgi:hypothetical protein